MFDCLTSPLVLSFKLGNIKMTTTEEPVENCEKPNLICDVGTSSYIYKTCLNSKHICNGQNDCLQGEDEASSLCGKYY